MLLLVSLLIKSGTYRTKHSLCFVNEGSPHHRPCNSAAHAVDVIPLALPLSCPSVDPPDYADIDAHRPPELISPQRGTVQSPNLESSSKPAVKATHPRVAVILGVHARWHIPLQLCRGLSTAPASWWGLRCAFTFLGELLLNEDGELNRGTLDAEKRFRITEVFLAILWCSASGYLSFFFADCLMSRWLLNYTPGATVVRMLTTNALIAYITSWVLFLSGASEDPRMLLPAWVSIATTLTMLYHLTQRKMNIKRETSASIGVFSIASFLSMCSLLLQLHLTRDNSPIVPLFAFVRKSFGYLSKLV